MADLFRFPLLTPASEQGTPRWVQSAPRTEPFLGSRVLHVAFSVSYSRFLRSSHSSLSLKDADSLLYPDSSAEVIFRRQCFNWYFSVKSANRLKTNTHRQQGSRIYRQCKAWSFISLGNKTTRCCCCKKIKIKNKENGNQKFLSFFWS